MESSKIYVGWVEDFTFQEDPLSVADQFALLDLLHPDDVLSLINGTENFATLVQRGEEEGLKTLPIVLRNDQLTDEWKKAIIQVAENPKLRLAVELGDPPYPGVGRAQVALTGWAQEGIPEVTVKSIGLYAAASTRKIDKALQSTRYMTAAAAKQPKPRGQFIKDILEWRVGKELDVYCAIYDVGQGSANAIVDKNEHPRVFFDIGKPISIYNRTRPPNIPKFFHCDITKGSQSRAWLQAPVILSHWDFDHWGGVLESFYLISDGKGGKYASLKLIHGALERFWIVPDQTRLNLGPTHVELIRRLAKTVNHHGVTALQYWPQNLPRLQFSQGVIVKAVPDPGVGAAISAQRNNSGLVLLITKQFKNLSRPPAGILLQGDARCNSIPLNGTGVNLVGLVVSHHGGEMGGNPPVPNASLSHRVAAVCSVGEPDAAGKKPYGHPHPNAISDHKKAHWTMNNFTYNRAAAPTSPAKLLGNFWLSLNTSFPSCGCDCVCDANLSLRRAV